MVEFLVLHRETKKCATFLQYAISLVSVDQLYSPPQSETIIADIWSKIYRLTLIVVPHYRVKCEQVQFCENLHCCSYFVVTKKM